tara:strand:+ start:1074 stop:1706 length:633 start_codon:yes stop_codon:yes gene_type:complete
MASNEHSSLEESQLHNPKGFSTASNNTVLSKNSSGALTWSSRTSIKCITIGGYHSSSGSVGDYYAKQFSADFHNFNQNVDPQDATNGTINSGRKWAHMYSEFVCPTSGSIVSWKIMHGGTASADWDLELYKLSITDATGTNADLTQLGSTCHCTNNASGSAFVEIVDMSVSGTLTFAANDVIICLVRKQTAGSKNIFWNSTLEIILDYDY